MDSFEDELEGMIWGFRVCLWWSVFSIFFIILAWFFAARKYGPNYTQFHDEQVEGKGPFEYDE